MAYHVLYCIILNKSTLFLPVTFLDPMDTKFKHPKIRWTDEQKKITKEYFKNNIRIKKPPTETEIEIFRKDYPIMENKDWKKIKVFVFNIYNKK